MAPERGFWERFWPSDRRGAKRKTALPLAAYYWDGAEPKPRQVKDVSLDGMYVVTQERWYPNTMLQITLVRMDRSRDDPASSIRLAARVVRSDKDGVGLAFVLQSSGNGHAKGFFEIDTTKSDLKTFLATLRRDAAYNASLLRAKSSLVRSPGVSAREVN
jgi:hypothetical protein